jgi:hypothetical protein
MGGGTPFLRSLVSVRSKHLIERSCIQYAIGPNLELRKGGVVEAKLDFFG